MRRTRHPDVPDHSTLLKLAAEATLSVDGVRRYFRGDPLRSTTKASADAACDALGIARAKRDPQEGWTR